MLEFRTEQAEDGIPFSSLSPHQGEPVKNILPTLQTMIINTLEANKAF